MPEGPEVKTISNNLNDFFKHSILLKLNITGGRYKKKNIELLNEFFNLKENQRKITNINCKGKFIWFQFSDINWSLWITLGMAGGFVKSCEKNCDIEFISNNGNLWFKDQRHFGTLKFCNQKEKLNKKISSLGPDILSNNNDFSIEEFIKILRKYNEKTLPKILMDQSKISGIGNYLKSEILYKAKLSPFKKIKDISNEELYDLFKISKKIANDSLKAGGASTKKYSNLKNNYENSEKIIFKFNVYNRIYDDNNYKIVKSKTDDGRMTHWVPEIQK